MKIFEIISESKAVDELKKDLLTAKKNGDKLDYDGVGKIMEKIWNKHDMTGQELHDVFVSEVGLVPDTWIKKQKQVSEIQRTPQQKSDNWQSDERSEEVEGLQMVPGSDRYGYVDYSYSNQERLNLVGADKAITFYDTKPEGGGDILYIGYLEFRNIRFYGTKKAVQVSNVMLDKRYRGKGIGTMMYTTALKLGYIIIADETQTPSARRMWVNLSQTPGVSVKGIIKISKKYVDVENTDRWNVETAKKNRKKLEKIGAQPLAPIEKYGSFDLVPFVFPVEPGKDGRELAAQGLQLYVPGGADQEDFISIYAKWVG